jgi:hypothetical protein
LNTREPRPIECFFHSMRRLDTHRAHLVRDIFDQFLTTERTSINWLFVRQTSLSFHHARQYSMPGPRAMLRDCAVKALRILACAGRVFMEILFCVRFVACASAANPWSFAMPPLCPSFLGWISSANHQLNSCYKRYSASVSRKLAHV